MNLNDSWVTYNIGGIDLQMAEIYLSSNYLIYALISSFDIYQDNGKLLTNFRRNSLLMKNVFTK